MKVTVVPADRAIYIDGTVLKFDYAAAADIHAIQWDGAKGVIEKTDGGREVTTDNAVVQPFIDAYNAEIARLKQAEIDMAAAEAAAKSAEEQAALDFYNSPEQVAIREAEAARLEAKRQAIIDNLPSWTQVAGAVDAITNLADAKVFLKKMARIVYWLAKDTEA